MDNGSASAGASHLTGNSLRTASSFPVLSLPQTTSAANPSFSTSIAFPPPPVPWSEPPVPSPLPHPPLIGSNVSFASPARRTSVSSGMRFAEPTSPSVTNSSSILLPPPPTVSSSSSSGSSSTSASSSSSSESASSPSSTGSTTLSSSGTSSVSSRAASPDNTTSVAVLASAAPGGLAAIPSLGGSPSRSFRNPGSPTYSAFASASDSPFFSPSTPTSATPFLTPPSGSFSSTAIHTPRGDRHPPVRPNPASLLSSPLQELAFSPPQYGAPRSPFLTAGGGPLESPGPSFLRTTASPGSLFPRESMSPTSAGRPRSCDVFISLYGKCPALLRFAKWMRAELELQGVACFSADRSLFSDTRSHDITRRIMNSASFGVVIISRSVFRSQWTVEELRVFLDRRNLVPVFFDLAPSDVIVKDIIERQGRIWEKHGGELWNLYGGDKGEWKYVVEGVLSSEEWRLEAHDGNWRACIRKAVSLFGTRLGRRSIAERERVQRERIDVDEFPFPRNAAFTGRVKELKHLEDMLSLTMEYPDQELVEPLRKGEVSAVPGDPVESTLRGRDFESRGASSSGTRRTEDGKAVKGKEPEGDSGVQTRIEIEAEREVIRERESQRGRDMQRGRSMHRERHMQRKRESIEDLDPASRSGCACISGVAGIGKTELALEYAYRNADKYRMILWLRAENRYIRQNYLNLSMFLCVDVGSETLSPDRGRVRSFDEQETETCRRIRREMSGDVPYLLIVDNLESERDWWDEKEITESLPSPGSASHVIITTRLPRVMQVKCMELTKLSNTEAVDLMRCGRQLSSVELEVLREIDDKLARLTLGLAIMGRLLGQLSIMPSELLELMDKAEGITNVRNREDEVLRNNPQLFRLLNVCFALLENSSGPAKLASKMALVGGWFAPSPIPLDLLAQAAALYPEKSRLCRCWGNCDYVVFRCCMASKLQRRGAEAAYLLIQYGLARRNTRQGCIYLNEVIQVYLRRRGGIRAAKAMVQGVRKSAVLTLHLEQFWAACFLVLRFGNDAVTVELRVPELLSFTRKVVLPLALRTFSTFTRCQAALELLQLCFNSLDDVEKSFVSQIGDKSFFRRRAKGRYYQVDDYVWHDLTLLKAHLLETRAKLLLRGGLCEAGEEACRTCISIRMVMLGAEHTDTISAQETLAKLVRARNNG